MTNSEKIARYQAMTEEVFELSCAWVRLYAELRDAGFSRHTIQGPKYSKSYDEFLADTDEWTDGEHYLRWDKA